MIKFNVTPIFPRPFAEYTVDENMDNFFEVVKNLKYISHKNTYSNIETTEDKHILDSLPEVKEIFKKYFYHFKNEFLHFNDIEFDITTSWATKTQKGGFSASHAHYNSFYSGVYYFESMPEEGADVIFERPEEVSSFLIQPNEIVNDVTTNFCFYKPVKNTLIFFPSFLKHRVALHEIDDIRYSLAFNVIPVGKFGFQDSTLNVRLNKN
jgi:uncharacterized protein (TIGR02466 family)